jgi:hypothetical protein
LASSCLIVVFDGARWEPNTNKRERKLISGQMFICCSRGSDAAAVLCWEQMDALGFRKRIDMLFILTEILILKPLFFLSFLNDSKIFN